MFDYIFMCFNTFLSLLCFTMFYVLFATFCYVFAMFCSSFLGGGESEHRKSEPAEQRQVDDAWPDLDEHQQATARA